MPRIRTVKPEFWRNEKLASCTPFARLLSIGLLNFCDSAGYFSANVNLLRADIFPFESFGSEDIHGLLTELADIGYIELFKQTETADRKLYGKVSKFLIHQKIRLTKSPRDGGEQPSRIKDLFENDEKIGSDFELDACSNAPSMACSNTVQEQGNRGTGEMEQGNIYTRDNSRAIVNEVFEYWKSVMGKRPHTALSEKRRRRIEKALKTYSKKFLFEAIDGCAKSDFHMGENEDNKFYNDIELIFRDEGHIERFQEMLSRQAYRNKMEKHTKNNLNAYKNFTGT